MVAVLGAAVAVVVLASLLVSAWAMGQPGHLVPATAVSRDAAVAIAQHESGVTDPPSSAVVEPLGATGLLAPPASASTLVWAVTFEGQTTQVCPPAQLPGITPAPCWTATIRVTVIIDATTGAWLTTESGNR